MVINHKNTLFYSKNKKKDEYFNNQIKIFLDEYKIFKNIKLNQNIKTKKFKKKKPFK